MNMTEPVSTTRFVNKSTCGGYEGGYEARRAIARSLFTHIEPTNIGERSKVGSKPSSVRNRRRDRLFTFGGKENVRKMGQEYEDDKIGGQTTKAEDSTKRGSPSA